MQIRSDAMTASNKWVESDRQIELQTLNWWCKVGMTHGIEDIVSSLENCSMVICGVDRVVGSLQILEGGNDA